jgi:hypothetical protein
MTLYAEGTAVDPGASRLEIERLLTRYGATAVVTGYQPGRGAVQFEAYGRQVRIAIDLPAELREFARTPTGRTRSAAQQQEHLRGEVRRRWRSLVLVLKARLEAAASGIETFETAFMPYLVLPDGSTVADHVGPAVAQAYATGELPPLIPQKAIEGS